MDFERITHAQLPALPVVVGHLVNTTPNKPGAMTWTGRTVELLELQYAFLAANADLPVAIALDWTALRERLAQLPDQPAAVALDTWLRAPIESLELIRMGPGKWHFDHLVERIRAALEACAAR